jgi:long-chain acyl-CoA synthetase
MNPARTVGELIAQAARFNPQSVYALATETKLQISFADLAQTSLCMSALWRAAGVERGDTVSIVMPNGLNTLRVLLGAMAQGVVVNPVNLLSQVDQMRYVLEHSDCKLVVAAPEWEVRVRGLVANINRQISVVVADPDALSVVGEQLGVDALTGPEPSPDDMALLMYTSGTTGVPKGVMLSQANVVANALAISAEYALTENDRVLGVLPLYHINAFAVTMLAPLAHRGSVAVAPKFSVARFWDQARECQCTWLNVVPTMISYLLEAPAPSPLPHYRFCRSASAALPPEHLRGFEARFGIGVIETMGLTETMAPSFSNPLESSRRKLGSVGLASGCEARIVNDQLVPQSANVTGELVIRGPNVMHGYYKNPAATTASFTLDHWLRTGDLGHCDEDGFFFVTGRIKELIIKGGENIAPREIDEVLLKHAAILEAAAVGIPDKHYGQEIMACVVLRPNTECGAEALTAFCQEHLGRYKTPKVFRFVSELPRGPSGKVQRLKLLEGL